MKGIKKMIAVLLLMTLVGKGISAQPVLHDHALITITNFTVYEKDAKLFVEWATDGTVATNNWEVQLSDDGKEFSTIAYVLGPDPRQPGDKYQYREKTSPGRNASKFYRLKHVDVNGNEQLSNVFAPAK